MTKEKTAIIVKNVRKDFKLPHEKHSTAKGKLINSITGNTGYTIQSALKNISFDVREGEFFGIVGRNGSGKSTLLKCIAGVYYPTSGSIHVKGSLVPFIELGVGFNPDLSGRDNVFLNGALLGFNEREMEKLYPEIVDFAELEEFMDQKLKNYSSGMQVRLAFSIAIQAKGDILLLDEVLAVGDAAFQKKCNDYFDKLKKEKKTVVLVTHDMGAVQKYCTRAILIEDGKVKKMGLPTEVANQYSLDNMNASSATVNSKNKSLSGGMQELEVKLLSKEVLNENDTLIFEVEYKFSSDIQVDLAMSLIKDNRSVIEQNTKTQKIPSKRNAQNRVYYELPVKNLTSGGYRIDVAIFNRKNAGIIGFNTDAASFMLERSDGVDSGYLSQRGVWKS